MIQITDKTECTGCAGCANVCPTCAITMQYDEEGFYYPVVDQKKCIDCDRCEQVCHMRHRREREVQEIEYYASCLKREGELQNVSSGGVFWALAQNVISQAGVVYGVVQKDKYCVCHDRATTLEECKLFRKSKYIESYIGDTFNRVHEDLLNKKLVLFSGTGCQIAGLKEYLRTAVYDNLITCEIVCHGVPSKAAYKAYIEEIEKKYNSKIKAIIFRDKSKGWVYNQIAITFENGTEIKERSSGHLFHGGYLMGMFNRPSCGTCRYADLPRIGDITLADFWKYDGKILDLSKGMGISLVVCTSDKGKSIFSELRPYLHTDRVSEEQAIDSCRHLSHSPVVHKKREEFFKLLIDVGYEKAISKYFKRGLMLRPKELLNKVLYYLIKR